MKKILLGLCLIVLGINLSTAQNRGFNYKALLADNGTAISNQNVSLKFTVLESGTTAVYQEIHTATTDANGIVSVSIGEGTVVSGDFNTIDWASHPYFLKVEIDTGSGYQNFGTSELKSVPYAKYAQKAGNTFSGDFNDLTNVPAGLSDGDDDTHLTDAQIAAMGYIKNPNDADHDATNELQTISKTGNTVTLSYGGGSFTDADTHLTETQVDNYVSNNGYLTNEVDGSISNELQNLTLSGNQLSISNGNNVTFTGWDTDASDDVQALNDLSDAKTTSRGVFVGTGSGTNANTNGDLVGLGLHVMTYATSADYSVGIGNYALSNLTSGSYNTAIGYGAGASNTTGHGNVFIGYYAGATETGSNKLYIANSSTSSPLIGGDFDTNEVTINGSLAIKDGTQGAGKVLVSDANGKGHWSNSLPTQQKVMYITQLEAVSFKQTDKLYHTNQGVSIYDSNSTTQIYFPITLPYGVTVSSIVVYYKDNSTNDYVIAVYKENIGNGQPTYVDQYVTSGATSSHRQHVFNINASAGSYKQYYVAIFPKTGSHWAGNNSVISGIRVLYSE